jgi:NAD(P)-dependent dehydrogenase (short-subunit alcohol dehydrogenase family)
MIDLSGQTGVITGAGTGIGQTIARVLAEHGADVAIIDLDGEAAERASSSLMVLGRRSIAVRGDVSNHAEMVRAFERIERELGELTFLVNNAGISSTGYAVDLAEEEWDRHFAVNTRGTFVCARICARMMIPRRRGRIVNMASRLGLVGGAMYSHYSASKFAVIGFTQSLAYELAPYGITVNAVAPGKVDTPMLRREWEWESKLTGRSASDIEREIIGSIPLQRLATQEDVGRAVVFLLSDYAAYTTGHTLNVTGGLRMD